MIPKYGQPADPSLAALLVLAAGVAGMAAITLSPDLRRRINGLRPLPPQQRLFVYVAHQRRRIARLIQP